jgi:hypothetical protein
MPIPLYDIERNSDGEPIRLWWRGYGPTLKEQEMSWREIASPIIRKVIADTKSDELHLLKARLREAYPFGEYAMYPLTVWRDEIKRQLGTKPPLQQGGRKVEAVSEGQGRLFI